MKKIIKNRYIQPKTIIFCSILITYLIPFNSIAAIVDWRYNNDSNEWSIPENWSNNSIPGTLDTVRINQYGNQGPVISNGHFIINSLSIGEMASPSSTNGALAIRGGELTTSSASIGTSSGLNGNVIVTGLDSIWNINNHMFLGNSGNGSLTIENGGTVNMLSSTIYMGLNNPGGVDYLTVSGTGSSLNINSWLLLAYGGNSSFHDTTSIVHVKDGGTITADGIDVGYGGHGILNVNGGYINSQHGLISPYSGSKGEVLVTGTGSRWSISEELNIAYNGNANILVNKGGVLENKDGYLASGSGSIANVIITDSGSYWNNTNSLQIGVFGDATLMISNGGSVSSTIYGVIGTATGSKGLVEVSGIGSNWHNTNALYIGNEGSGTLTISQRGTVFAGMGVAIGAEIGSEGKLNIGSPLGKTPVAPGILKTPIVSFGNGNGSIVFNHNDDSGSYVFTAPIENTGKVDIYKGNTTFTGQSTYQGDTTIHDGTLTTGGTSVLSPNSAYNILSKGTLNINGYNNQVLSINNSGFLRLAGKPQRIGSQLTTDTYTSNGGVLELNTVLGADNSLSDKLISKYIVLGDKPTTIFVNNIKGTGALTKNKGIMIVEALNASESQKNTFILGHKIIAGAYEYVLNQDNENQSWYLVNTDNNTPLFNPSAGAYLANQTVASALFMHTLYDRQGHANNIVGGSEQKSSVWVRAASSNTKNDSVNGNMRVDTDSNLIHLGGDIGKWQVQEGNLHLGVMGAYGQTESDVRSKKTGTTAKGKVTGYSVGLYGTWFADEAQGKGLYVDSWAQYGWYKNKVSGQGQAEKEEKYDSNNWALSLEAGYGLHLATRGNTEIMLTPQVQVTYNNYSADDHQDRNNLKVSGSKADDVITRVGARLYGRAIEGYSAKPFIEANWLHHTAKNELSFNGEVLKDGVPKDRAEAKLGLQGTISKNWKVWGQVGAQWGGANYTRYEGQAGLNYQW